MKITQALVNWLISLALLVAGVLTLFLVWQNVYLPQVEANNKLKADIQVLEVSLATQAGYKKDEAKYKSEAARLEAEADAILSTYPIDLWEEDHIAYVDYVSGKTNMKITSLNWGQSTPVGTLSNGQVLTREQITFNYSRSYASLKDLIEFLVNDTNNHTSLRNITLSYNAGKDTMTGTLYIDRYYLTDSSQSHDPAKPDSEIETGQDNILD